jgi:DnaJ-class molecular chaperone
MQRDSSAHVRNGLSEGTETRECRSCLGSGSVLLDATYDHTTGELVQEVAACFICKGAGEVSVYLYSVPRRR